MPATKIIDNLYLGSKDDYDELLGKGYTMIDVRGYVEPTHDKKLNWRNALWLSRQIHAYLEAKMPVLVFCQGGRERSPAVIVTYFMDYKDFSIDYAYDFVKDKRPIVKRRDFFEVGPVEFKIIPPSKIPKLCWYCEELMGCHCRLGNELSKHCEDFSGPKDLSK